VSGGETKTMNKGKPEIKYNEDGGHMRPIGITGARGFLGQHIAAELTARGKKLKRICRPEFDLMHQSQAAQAVLDTGGVIHAAAEVGGVRYNDRLPGKIWVHNTLMGVYVLDSVFERCLSPFLFIGTSCSYPDKCPEGGWSEADLFNGLPTGSNAAYGLAKRNIIAGMEALCKQERLKRWGAIIFCNLFGPGDKFGPVAHVLPDIVRKMYLAKADGLKELLLLGTGEEEREFLFVLDAARAVADFWDFLETEERPFILMNYGSGFSIKINELVASAAKLVGYEGTVKWSGDYAGQRKKLMSSNRAKGLGLWREPHPFGSALEATVNWMLAWLGTQDIQRLR